MKLRIVLLSTFKTKIQRLSTFQKKIPQPSRLIVKSRLSTSRLDSVTQRHTARSIYTVIPSVTQHNIAIHSVIYVTVGAILILAAAVASKYLPHKS